MRHAQAIDPDVARLQCHGDDGQWTGPRRARDGGRDQGRRHLARDLPTLVAEPGRLDRSLLGMNFINTLSGFDMRGERLILRD
jgi:hypothetical protein